MSEVIFLGYKCGFSKNNNKPYAFISLAIPFTNGHGNGYSAQCFFVDRSLLDKVSNCEPLTMIKARIMFVNGANALIDLEV